VDYSTIKKVVNLTPHNVRVCVGKDIITIPPSGKVARLSMKSKPHGTLHGMPVSLSGDGGVINNPEVIEGVVYIASSVVAKSLKRDDVLSPDTTDEGVLRDGEGNVFAVKRLQCFAEEK
jgi:hypothetical protein